MPERIQLSRAKGWTMPANTVKVDRTTKWGNPFVVGPHGTREQCVNLFTKLLGGYVCISHGPGAKVLDEYLAMAKRDIHQLHGKNLACWCPLPKPGERDLCHAAVLMDTAANERVTEVAIRRLWDQARGRTPDGMCGWDEAKAFAQLLTARKDDQPADPPPPAPKPAWPFPISAHEEKR